MPEVIAENGGVPVRTRVGHSFIKQKMAETGAVFGGEHSAHYYFAANYGADSGLIATVQMLSELTRSDDVLSKVRVPYERYSQSGEINTHVDDVDAVLAGVSARYADGRQDHLDGLTVEFDTLVVQPAAVEHRAVAAPQPRSRDPRRVRRPRRRAARPDHQQLTSRERTRAMPLAPELLSILACPEDKGPLYYLEDLDVLFNPRLQRVYRVRDGIP